MQSYRVKPLTSPLGKCSKTECAMMQRYDKCTEQISAKLFSWSPKSESASYFQPLFAFGEMLYDIVAINFW